LEASTGILPIEMVNGKQAAFGGPSFYRIAANPYG